MDATEGRLDSDFVHTNWGPRMDANEPFPTPGAPRKMKRFMVQKQPMRSRGVISNQLERWNIAWRETRKHRTGSTTGSSPGYRLQSVALSALLCIRSIRSSAACCMLYAARGTVENTGWSVQLSFCVHCLFIADCYLWMEMNIGCAM